MYKESAASIFSISNFFDELCILDQDGFIHYYQVCPSGTSTVTIDQVIGKHISKVFPTLTLESNEILQALQTKKAICTFHDYCLNYRGEAYPGYVSVFPLLRKKDFAGVAIALKYLRPEYENEFIQIRDRSFRRKRYDNAYTVDDIITCDPYMNKLKDKIKKVSRRDSTVLIQGNTGTGKELVAQSLHYSSPRASGPFISQNCSAIPDNLLESTLFGTEKGSFTGAVTNQGLLELANGGTLFLDEINSMNLALQSKILASIENKSVRHLGGHEDINLDVRIIAAINEDPFSAIENNRLRSDLFYRLNVVNFHLTDLKDRPDDIAFLTHYYIDYYNSDFGMQVKGLSPKVAELFATHTWPGNIRELRNVIEGAFVIADGDFITEEDVPEYLSHQSTPPKSDKEMRAVEDYAGFLEYTETLEREFIENAISRCHTKAEAAVQLGITRQVLNYKLHKLNIVDPK